MSESMNHQNKTPQAKHQNGQGKPVDTGSASPQYAYVMELQKLLQSKPTQTRKHQIQRVVDNRAVQNSILHLQNTVGNRAVQRMLLERQTAEQGLLSSPLGARLSYLEVAGVTVTVLFF